MFYLYVYCYHGYTNAGYHIHIALVSQDMICNYFEDMHCLTIVAVFL